MLELFPPYVFEIYRINHLTYQKNVKKMSKKCQKNDYKNFQMP